MGSPFQFQRHGQCGATVSHVLPHLAQHVDDITFLHACVSEEQNHVPACYVANTGIAQVGSPHVGSWATYGMASEHRELPEFVVMYDHRSAPEGGANLWSSGFLPGENQGVTFRPTEHFGRSVMVKHVLEEAARAGCRVAVLEYSMTQDVEDIVAVAMKAAKLSNYTVIVDPNPPTELGPFEPITVCRGCYQMLTPNMMNELYMSKPVFCKSCGCLLYLPEDRSEG